MAVILNGSAPRRASRACDCAVRKLKWQKKVMPCGSFERWKVCVFCGRGTMVDYVPSPTRIRAEKYRIRLALAYAANHGIEHLPIEEKIAALQKDGTLKVEQHDVIFDAA